MPKRTETRTKGSGITRHQRSVTVFDMTQPLSFEEAHEFTETIKAAAARPLWDKEKAVTLAEASLAAIKEKLPADHDNLDFRPHADLGWYFWQIIRLDQIDRESIRVFEAVNFVDGTPLIVLINLSVASDNLTGAPRLTDCTCKIAEAQVAMRLN